jgi:integrase
VGKACREPLFVQERSKIGKQAVTIATALQIKTAKPGLHRDAEKPHLYLQVTGAARSWVFIYKNRHTNLSEAGIAYRRKRTMGLGSARVLTLAKAREQAQTYNEVLLAGGDPIQHRAAQRPTARPTFSEVAKMFYDAHKEEWHNLRYRKLWWSQLETHILPRLGDIPINTIATGDVLTALKPIWSEVMKTADDLRRRGASVWDYAKALKWVVGDNPFAWETNLKPLLADAATRESKHFTSLPWPQVPGFMAELRAQPGIHARAVEFGIRTNLRTDAVINARWRDIDLVNAVWTVPKEFVKGRRGKRKEFKCPLTAPCIALLEALPSTREADERVFPGLGRSSLLHYVKRFKRMDADGKAITIHGFRSSFRTWAGEMAVYPREIIELAMQHVVAGKVEASYWRGDAFSMRMSLMADWSAFCDRANEVC